MPSKKTVTLLIAVLAGCGFVTSPAPSFAASAEQVLYNFCSLSGCTDGSLPIAGLTFDGAGNLYGTAGGGAYGYGVVFQLTPGTGGTWTETVLYSFCPVAGCTDGGGPRGNLVFDAAGNLYGTTAAGGAYGSACGGAGCGTVFELSSNGNGTWTETVLHNFNNNGKDGWEPLSGLTLGTGGKLYGTTSSGGTSGACGSLGCGTIFELSPGANGTWTEKVLHHFCSVHACADGRAPSAGLVLDPKGTLYGTTPTGGSHNRPCGKLGCGVVFQLKRADLKWEENVLLSFNTPGGSQAGLILDAAGNLYGTTSVTAFELQKNDGWAEKTLHKFGEGKDGATLSASLVFDSGNLYSTTLKGGANGSGTVFRLTPQSNGKWTETILHSFINDSKDGFWPLANVIFDANGNLYGTTSAGGAHNSGTAFEITPRVAHSSRPLA
jgi:uncharacterized repeat protein (TIGR03803 family)